MTDFERKPGDKKNINPSTADPMKEFTRLLGRENLYSNWHRTGASSVDPSPQDKADDVGSTNEYYPNESAGNQKVYQQYDDSQPHEESNWAEDPYLASDNYWAAENEAYYAHQSTGGYEQNGEPTVYNSASVEEQTFYEGQDDNAFHSTSAQGLNWDNSAQEVDPYRHFENQFHNPQSVDTYSQNDGYHADGSQNSGGADFRHQFVEADPMQAASQQQFVSEETQYWTQAPHDEGAFIGNVDEQQWSQPLGDNQDVANEFSSGEFGLNANEGVYKHELGQGVAQNASHQTDVLSHPLQGQQSFDVNPMQYEDVPPFVEELSQEANESVHSSDNPLGHAEASIEEGHAQPSYFDEIRPLGAVVPPIRMTTEPRSFLGYGQAVSVLPLKEEARSPAGVSNLTANQSRVVLGRSNLVAHQDAAERKITSSDGSHLGRSINENPPTQPSTSIPQSQTPLNDIADNRGFEEALDDFNLTIKGDEKKRYRRASSLKTVRPDQNAVPETQNFDLPPVGYSNTDPSIKDVNPLEQEFSDVLAPGIPDASMFRYHDLEQEHKEEDFLSNESPAIGGHGQDFHSSLHESPVDASKYDWAASEGGMHAQTKKSGSGKKILLVLVLLAVILLAVGIYYVFSGGKSTSEGAVVIHRDDGAIKVAPKEDQNAGNDNQDQTVYNRVESGKPLQGEQAGLVDRSEAPIDLAKVDEQAPSESDINLDPNSVEARVLKATENSLSVHEVPTVTIRDGNSVNGDDINSIIAQERENVVTPGDEFRSHLQGQNQSAGGAAGSSSNGSASNPVVQNNVDNGLVANNDGASPTTTLHDNVAGSSPSTVNSSHLADATAMSVDDNSNNSLSLSALSANNETVGGGQSAPASNNHASLTQAQPSSNRNENSNTAADLSVAAAHGQTTSAQSQPVQTNVAANLSAGTFYVQIASQPSRDAAQQSLTDLKRQSQINALIAGHQVVIVAADIPGRGTYYRVRLAANGQGAANQLCEQLKLHQVSCFVGKT